MEQRDYILKEIEKISVLIIGMIGRLKRITDKKLFEQELESLYQELETSSGINIDQVLKTSKGAIEELFSDEGGFDLRNIELISDLLFEFSRLMDEKESKVAIEKAIFLLDLVDRKGKAFSFERQIKRDELRSYL